MNGILGKGIAFVGILLMMVVSLLIGIYVTGWATVYLAHMLLGSEYYTGIWTRCCIGLAVFLTFGGDSTLKYITKKSFEKAKN